MCGALDHVRQGPSGRCYAERPETLTAFASHFASQLKVERSAKDPIGSPLVRKSDSAKRIR